MITYKKAKAVLSVGDVVYSLNEMGGVEEAVVNGILADSISTDKGFLDFCLHGDVWWLTKIGAMERERYACLGIHGF